MSDHLDIIKSMILPSEDVKVVLQTLIVDPSGDTVFHERKRRILAVVSHLHTLKNSEQGCIFIFKPNKSPNGEADGLVIDRVVPIVGNFYISMAQSKRNTMDLRGPTSTAFQQPSTGMTITINPGQHHSQGTTPQPITLSTNDLHQLRSFLEQTKRVKATADGETAVASAAPESTYSWILPYTSTTVFSTIPPDVRTSRLSLHKLLSPATAGNPGDDMRDIQLIREEWIINTAKILCNTNAESSLRIRTGTFNVNGNMPSQDLNRWVRGNFQTEVIPPLKNISPLSLGLGKDEEDPFFSGDEQKDKENISDDKIDRDPDLLVFGFQELDLSAGALIYSVDTTREDAWTDAILAGLGEKAELYVKLASKQLVGMLLMMFAKKNLKERFTDIRTTSVGAGIMGLMGNKGATALRVTYSPLAPSTEHPVPTIITFVNSHLAAFDEMLERRNADFHDLSRRLLFRPSADSRLEGEDENYYPINLSIFETDVLFWIVHLNYRVELPSQDIRTILTWPGNQKLNLRELLKFDQFRNSVDQGLAFEGFVEYPISHFPTYRFSSGLTTDQLGYDMKRKPAWTDRILHMASRSTTVIQLSYQGHSEITMSDHRPVSAEFVVKSPLLDLIQYEGCLKDLNKDVLDMEELEIVPKMTVEPLSIDFGQVRYKKKVSKSFVVRNCGETPCAYRFVPLDTGKPIHPAWLRVKPMIGLLLPDQEATVDLTVHIDKSSAPSLDAFQRLLEFTLVLHTELGKEHFISINAVYETTCFANSLDHLVRLPGPIRSVMNAKELLNDEEAGNAPKEVMRLVNWLMSTDEHLSALFTQPGDHDLIDIIRECLDTGQEFSFPENATSREIAIAFADALVEFLDSFTESLVPPALHQVCAEVTNREDAFGILDKFSPACVNIWISVTAFLHFTASQNSGDMTHLDKAQVLAAIFGPVVLREDTISPLAKREFLLYFIV